MWFFLLFILTSPFSLSGMPTTAASTIFVDPSNLDSKMDGATSYIQKCIKFSKLSIKYRIPLKKIPGINLVPIRLINTSISQNCFLLGYHNIPNLQYEKIHQNQMSFCDQYSNILWNIVDFWYKFPHFHLGLQHLFRFAF